MSGHFNEYYARPRDPISDEHGHCANCECKLYDDDDYMEHNDEHWCEYCWSKREKGEDEE